MKREIKARLIQQGKEILKPYVNVDKWKSTTKTDDNITCDIIFRRYNNRLIIISNVYYNEKGEILQYGSNFGDLVL